MELKTKYIPHLAVVAFIIYYVVRDPGAFYNSIAGNLNFIAFIVQPETISTYWFIYIPLTIFFGIAITIFSLRLHYHHLHIHSFARINKCECCNEMQKNWNDAYYFQRSHKGKKMPVFLCKSCALRVVDIPHPTIKEAKEKTAAENVFNPGTEMQKLLDFEEINKRGETIEVETPVEKVEKKKRSKGYKHYRYVFFFLLFIFIAIIVIDVLGYINLIPYIREWVDNV